MTRPIIPAELNYTCYTVLLSDLAHIPAVSQGNGLPQHTSAQA